MKKRYFLLFVIISFISFPVQSSSTEPARSDNKPSFDENFKKEITDTIVFLMKKNNIPGLSVSIVNNGAFLWSDAFGVKKRETADSINVNTVFSLQSISKSITTAAVMIAVQEGLVSLDTPIVSYIADFTVNSKFEQNPEKKITLRHLLSHRSGLTHEAPVGNNYQVEFESFEQHIKSISGTWLKSKVGKIYSYSNLGMDLAGYIIQLRSGMEFEDYVKLKLFKPLDMVRSSFDWKEIRNENNRATGHNKNYTTLPLEFAMIPAGACYSDVTDMGKFLQFHLNKGKYNGKVVLKQSYFEEMYEIPFCNSDIGYALGIDIARKDGIFEYNHSGGGFGFQTVIKWIPQLNIGTAVLTNSANHDNIHKLIADIIINKIKGMSGNSESGNQQTGVKRVPVTLSKDEYSKYSGLYVMTEGNQEFELLLKDSLFGAEGAMGFIPFNFVNHEGELYIEGISPEIDGDYRIELDRETGKPLYLINKIDRPILYFNEVNSNGEKLPDDKWDKYTGSYSRKTFDKITARHKVHVRNGSLYFDLYRLEEYIPGLFYGSNGEVLDFRSEIPSYRNILLFKES